MLGRVVGERGRHGALAVRLRGQGAGDLGAGGRHLVRGWVQRVVGLGVGQHVAVGHGGNVGRQMRLGPRTESTGDGTCVGGGGVVVVGVRL